MGRIDPVECAKCARYKPPAMRIKGCGDYRGTSNAGSHPYAGKHTAQDQCVEFYGILKGKKCTDDIR